MSVGPRILTPEQIRSAYAALIALLPTGRLRFVTSLHRCQEPGPPTLLKTDEQIARCAAWARIHADPRYANPLADPRHFLARPMERIGELNAAGSVQLTNQWGDRIIGYAPNVLRALSRFVEAEEKHGIILPNGPGDAIVGIGSPLIIPNATQAGAISIITR
jgi:hypothetical protein